MIGAPPRPMSDSGLPDRLVELHLVTAFAKIVGLDPRRVRAVELNCVTGHLITVRFEVFLGLDEISAAVREAAEQK